MKRHNRLKSLYLRNIDNIRVSAEYAPIFRLFFEIVSTFDYFIALQYLDLKLILSVFFS